jgi:hypothetical protein
MKDFDLFGIETHPIPPNPHGLRAKRIDPNGGIPRGKSGIRSRVPIAISSGYRCLFAVDGFSRVKLKPQVPTLSLVW